jgi:hypothetical protein
VIDEYEFPLRMFGELAVSFLRCLGSRYADLLKERAKSSRRRQQRGGTPGALKIQVFSSGVRMRIQSFHTILFRQL